MAFPGQTNLKIHPFAPLCVLGTNTSDKYNLIINANHDNNAIAMSSRDDPDHLLGELHSNNDLADPNTQTDTSF